MKTIKKKLLKLLNLYTEKEVYNLFLEYQFELAQYLLGNRKERQSPPEFFKDNKKQ